MDSKKLVTRFHAGIEFIYFEGYVPAPEHIAWMLELREGNSR